MSIQQYLDKMRDIQTSLLEYIESQDDEEEFYKNFNETLNKNNIRDNPHDLRLLLHLIFAISNNHHRDSNFFNKIDKVILQFKDDMKKYFTNSEIFEIFKDNKRIILFLINENIIAVDKFITLRIKQLTEKDKNYCDYFYPENLTEKIENFDEKRLIGENDSYLCSLIRQDSVEDFISHTNRVNMSLSKTVIKPSLFETNPYLVGKELSIIEYAAFFGAIQIFQYLILNKVVLTPSLWPFVIHSNNADMIHILEDQRILPEDNEYGECLLESIKCHHNNVAEYIKESLMKDDYFDFKNEFVFDFNSNKCSFSYYNFVNIPDDFDHKFIFFYLCQYGYFTLVDYLLKNRNIDLTQKVVFLIEIF